MNLEELLVNETLCATTLFEDDVVICTPRKGQWSGGDELLITIPKLDKRKGTRTVSMDTRHVSSFAAFSIYFDYGSANRLGGIRVTFVDTKTIFFRTPPCKVAPGDQNLKVPIVVVQNDLILTHIEFLYLARKKDTPVGDVLLNRRYRYFSSKCNQCKHMLAV